MRQDRQIYYFRIIWEVDGVIRGLNRITETFSDFIIPSDKNSKKLHRCGDSW